MARIVFGKQSLEVADNGAILEPARELGIPFGCVRGVCGTCRTRVVSGMENLSSMTDSETDMGMGPGERLICQCSIKGGEVVLED